MSGIRKHHFLFIALLVMPLAVPANGDNVKALEGVDVLKLFAVDEGVTTETHPWTTGTNSAIRWLNSGISRVPDDAKYSYPFFREGKVIITNNGKVTHEVLDREVVAGQWKIRLKGVSSGYTDVDIVPSDKITQEDPVELAMKGHAGEKMQPSNIVRGEPVILLDKQHYVLKEAECSSNPNLSLKIINIKFEGKQPFWLISEHYRSNTGLDASYTIKYKEFTCEALAGFKD